MKNASVLAMTVVCALAMAAPGLGSDWPAWRGPAFNGTAPDSAPPLAWSESTNVKWRVELPGKGHSTPIVSGDRLYLTMAIPTDTPADTAIVEKAEAELPEWRRRESIKPTRVQRFAVAAVNRADGSVAWTTVVREAAPHEGTHAEGSWASASPVTDGRRIYAFFGSQGLYCLDMEGKVLWEKQFGAMRVKARFGEGGSPAIHGSRIFVNWDHEGECFIAALETETGKEAWRVQRDELTSWSTPLVVKDDAGAQVVVNAAKRIRSYDCDTGAVRWECGGMTTNVIPCPVLHSNLVICMSGFRGSAALAVRLDKASGDITDAPDAVAWRRAKDTPYVPSPVLAQGLLYFLKGNKGELSCVDAATGTPHYEAEKLGLPEPVYASPVYAGGRLYVTAKSGLTAVVGEGASFRVLATNKLDDLFSASPVACGKELYLRGHAKLYCIAE